MTKANLEQLYKQREALEYERMGYLEANNKAGARRKEKQIEKIDLQIQIINLVEIKKELQAYKKVCRNYPDIQNRVRNILDGGGVNE